MRLTRACHPILLKSTVFVHQIHLAAYVWLHAGCNKSAKSVFPEVAHNSLKIPLVSMFREISEYSRFSRFVATLPDLGVFRLWLNRDPSFPQYFAGHPKKGTDKQRQVTV